MGGGTNNTDEMNGIGDIGECRRVFSRVCHSQSKAMYHAVDQLFVHLDVCWQRIMLYDM